MVAVAGTSGNQTVVVDGKEGCPNSAVTTRHELDLLPPLPFQFPVISGLYCA